MSAAVNMIVFMAQSNSESSEDLNSLKICCETGNSLELERFDTSLWIDAKAIYLDSYDNTIFPHSG
jgi:hypothetical protein